MKNSGAKADTSRTILPGLNTLMVMKQKKSLFTNETSHLENRREQEIEFL